MASHAMTKIRSAKAKRGDIGIEFAIDSVIHATIVEALTVRVNPKTQHRVLATQAFDH
jgi:hypothetical protein